MKDKRKNAASKKPKNSLSESSDATNALVDDAAAKLNGNHVEINDDQPNQKQSIISDSGQQIKVKENKLKDENSTAQVTNKADNSKALESKLSDGGQLLVANGVKKEKIKPKVEPPSESILITAVKPWSLNIQIDVLSVAVFVIALATRMWKLEEPNSIVFDELHYGKFAGLYMKRIFFFDSHPPLGKQLIALAGYIAGFDGNTQFDRIGSTYGANVPVRALRTVPALFGSLLAPVVYMLIAELGFTYRTAFLGAIFVILDNALLTQSRFILMESILLFFSSSAILMALKFRKESDRPFSTRWWLWLILTAVSFACAICVKYVGIFSAALVLSILIYDFWTMIGDIKFTMKQLWLHFTARASVLILLPTFIYLFTFYIHLSVLTKAGPHDNIMTSAFQASLEGGLASITKGQPLEIVHGSQITLRHTHGRACWLHSHPHVYPIRYPDKRGSSHQQQVSCYSFKDVNNWWIVKRPDKNDLVVSEPIDRIKHGDVIQLIHGITSRALNSHDVAAPSSPQHQEVSCYIDYNISFPAQNLWKVEILNKETEGDVWHTIHSHIRLVHVNSTQALKFSGKQLPEWGFNQHEVVTDRVHNQDDVMWNVEEHRHTKSADQKERERELGLAEFVPLQPTQLSFFEKLWELQYKMFTVNQENVQDHVYSSDPLEWFLMNRGIAYWISPHSNAQIHLLGNILIWYTASSSLAIYLLLLGFYFIRRRRGCYDISPEAWEVFSFSGYIFIGGYLLHLIPFLAADRTLFLHHYLPAFLYKVFLLASLLEHIDYLFCKLLKPSIHKAIFGTALVSWLCAATYIFYQFSVFSYGTTDLTAQDVQNLRWKPTWDLIIHRP